ncbi:uncharacterized protein LOC132644100 [Lycium barbarum]|uniref:uncharacterized protein LOC132644100 n=1 Tax=Lycium barbarum TaxID=112863 RepID=UPI00293EE807|nr:uncharacterized protein LOC132644100 [Lycium barbarum]
MGRGFLATVDAVIRVKYGKMSMTVNGQEATFDVFKATRLPAHYEELKMISVVEPELTNAELDHFLASRDPLETAFVYGEDLKIDAEVEECLRIHDTSCAYLRATRCEETNLVLNWEKCHFMVREGIVLRHKISSKGIEVDKAKIEAIERLPPPVSVRGVRSFLGYAGFHRRFIKDFSKVANPLCNLLEKDVKFVFNEACLTAFEQLKRRLVPWYENMVNFIVSEVYPPGANHEKKKWILHDSRFYVWDEPYLYRVGTDQLIRRCVPEEEVSAILEKCHSSPYGGHHAGDRTAAKVLQSGFYWPTLFNDAHEFVRACDNCQRTGNIS